MSNVVKKYIVILLMGLFFSMSAYAQKAEPPTQVQQSTLESARQQLELLNQRNQIAQKNITILAGQHADQIKSITPYNVNPAQVLQAEFEYQNAQAKLNDVQLAVLENERALVAIQAAIRELNENTQNLSLVEPSTKIDDSMLLKNFHSQLNFQNSLLQIENARKSSLKTSLYLALQNINLTKSWYEQLFQFDQQRQFLAEESIVNAQIIDLQNQKNQWLSNLDALNNKLNQINNANGVVYDTQRFQLEIQILSASEHASLYQTQIILLQLQNKIYELVSINAKARSLASYGEANKRLTMLLGDLNDIKKVMDGKVSLIMEREDLIKQAQSRGIVTQSMATDDLHLLDTLISGYQGQLQQTTIMLDQLSDLKVQLKSEFAREIARRQGLPGFNLIAWQSLGMQLLALPGIVFEGLSNFVSQSYYALRSLLTWQVVSLSLFVVLGGLFCITGRRYLKIAALRVRHKTKKLTTNAAFIVIELLRRNLVGLILSGLLLGGLLFAGMPLTALRPAILLMMVWFIFKGSIGFARIFLLETAVEVSSHDLNLYRALKWTGILGGILTVATTLVHQLPVPYELRDFFNRVFMLFLLAVSIILLRGWRVVPNLLDHYVNPKKAYVRGLARLLSILIPLTFLSTALIGLFGYVDLAWAINKHEGVFLLVLTVYVLARGLLLDVSELLSELLISHVRSGWMWSRAVLKPLEKVVRLVLIGLSIVVLLKIYGWDRNSPLVQDVIQFFHIPLFELAGSAITPLSILEFVIVLAVFSWAIRWSREFSYRVLFIKVADLGLRNSLAIFTQYGMVVVGFFVILWVLGISVLALAAVLTVFGVGLAFGLRDLFKNYVSGIFLLMERPLKKGDYVSVSGREGEVTHIGMRSFTVTTWDHVDMLVPNSEVFDKPFTNWTLHDNLIRSVISIKINRVDDPHRVQALVLDIVNHAEPVVSEPEPQVLLKEIGDALIELEVRYHINLKKHSSQSKVRSEILFQIWDAFKAIGIKPPYPQQDVHIVDSRS